MCQGATPDKFNVAEIVGRAVVLGVERAGNEWNNPGFSYLGPEALPTENNRALLGHRNAKNNIFKFPTFSFMC